MNDDNPPSKEDIFDDRESILEVWKDERRSRDKSADLMWENLKLFSLLIPAVITVDTFFLGFMFDNPSHDFIYGLALLSSVLPGLVIALSWCGSRDLKRRWERTLESIAYINKLEGLLGLREEIPKDKRVFENDRHLFERHFQETKDIKTESEFKAKKMYTNNMYTAMNKVYSIFIIIGLFLWSAPLVYLAYLNYPRLAALLQ
jgi:hypothetical protein